MKWLILFITCAISTVNSANILFYIGLGSPSHQSASWPLIESLGQRGHKVTLLSLWDLQNKSAVNVEHFRPREFKEYLESFQLTSTDAYVSQVEGWSKYYIWRTMWRDGINLCTVLLKSPETQEWVKRSKFDLVFLDVCANDCALGFAHKFKAQFIQFSPTNFLPWQFENEGINPEGFGISDMQFQYKSKELTLWEKFVNEVRPVYWYYFRKYSFFPELEGVIKEHLNVPDLPPLDEMEKKSSLVFINSHFSNELTRSLPPSVISVGGMHCYKETKKEIPQDLKSFLDQPGKVGFIYISFGSFVKFKDLPADITQTFLSLIREMKQYNFLWKYEEQFQDQKPENLYISPWFPQQELLAHPKIKLFITQGGQPSLQEAIFNGVPVLSIPFLTDQWLNSDATVVGGWGLRLSIVDIDIEKLRIPVQTMLNDTRFMKKAKEISRLFKDRPMTPVETAVWWTEYALRNKDSLVELKPLGYNMSWWSKRLLDVWAVLFLLITFSLLILGFIIKNVMKCIFGQNETTKDKSNTKQSANGHKKFN